MLVRYEYEPYNNTSELIAYVKDPSQLIADHIHPIALGGDEWDIDNIQTLCKSCNKEKTADDLKEIAKLRVIEKNQAKGQKQLSGVIP